MPPMNLHRIMSFLLSGEAWRGYSEWAKSSRDGLHDILCLMIYSDLFYLISNNSPETYPKPMINTPT